ncbi:MAG: DegT/DnrJ/EryC1/StrS family aminotransferase [Myxococcales bacterium FL481]|nr:MAG: DegT/DnrJ/EryC1/StrS family aminotransferase [Myxococcales bacterium FL481]
MTTSRHVPFVNLAAQYAAEREQLLPVIDEVLASGQWIDGPAVRELEMQLARENEVAHAVAVGSGTDALRLGMRALDIGPGDEVITPPNSFVASTGAIVSVGALPVFADVKADQTLDPEAVAAAITPRTKAIMPVHLTGRCADMPALQELAQRHRLHLIEDAAQAYGARLHGRRAGTMGDVGCFSAHPLKNLNAMGDAGFVLCTEPAVAQRLLRLRNNGLRDRNTAVEWGVVSRLDTVQAAVLRFRLDAVDRTIATRREHAQHYRRALDPAHVFVPPCRPHEFNTFHTFVVQVDQRDQLAQHLADHGIGTGIHYPRPIHLQPAAATFGYRAGDFPMAETQAERILSLPIHQWLEPDDVHYVADCANRFFAQATLGQTAS